MVDADGGSGLTGAKEDCAGARVGVAAEEEAAVGVEVEAEAVVDG